VIAGFGVESALRLDVDAMMRRGAIQPGAHIGGEMRFEFYDQELLLGGETGLRLAAGLHSPQGKLWLGRLSSLRAPSLHGAASVFLAPLILLTCARCLLTTSHFHSPSGLRGGSPRISSR
jgi:hypothetical protein